MATYPPPKLPDPHAPRMDSWGMLVAEGGWTSMVVDVDQHVLCIRITDVRIPHVDVSDPGQAYNMHLVYRPRDGEAQMLYEGQLCGELVLSAAQPIHLCGQVTLAVQVDSRQRPITTVVTVVHVMDFA